MQISTLVRLPGGYSLVARLLRWTSCSLRAWRVFHKLTCSTEKKSAEIEMILKLMGLFVFGCFDANWGDARPIKFVYRHLGTSNGSSRTPLVHSPLHIRFYGPQFQGGNSRRHSSLPVGPKSQNRALFLQYVSRSKRRLELMIPQPDSPLEVNLRFFFSLQFAAKNHPSLFGQIMS